MLEIELWSEPKNQKTAGAAVQSHDTAAVLSRPCEWTGPCVRQTRVSSREKSHAVLRSVVLVGMSIVVVAQICTPVLRRQKKSHRPGNGLQVGRKEVPSGDDKITSWTESR